MAIYVRRNGVLVDKETGEPLAQSQKFAKNANFPTPRLSHMEPYESPITGKEVTSWGERDREMKANDCYDPRDMPKGHVYRRGREVQLREAKEGIDDTGFEWRDI